MNHFLTDDQGNSLPYLNGVSFKIIRDENSRTEMFLNEESMVLSEISENKVKIYLNLIIKSLTIKFLLLTESLLWQQIAMSSI